MKKHLIEQHNIEHEPTYGLIWNQIKKFPSCLAEGSQHPPNVSGPAAAALISSGIGCLTMMISHHLSIKSKLLEESIWTLGSWIPGSHNPSKLWGNIGSYSGKETILLISWLLSWAILHFFWKEQKIKSKTIFFWMFVLFLAATVMSWRPLFFYLPLL
jgi:hypothetical protein